MKSPENLEAIRMEYARVLKSPATSPAARADARKVLLGNGYPSALVNKLDGIGLNLAAQSARTRQPVAA